MRKSTKKLAALSITEGFFPPPVWEGALKTRERARLLRQHWTDLDLSGDEVVTMYDCYPYLFSGAFPDIQPDALADFSLGIKLLAGSVFLADKIMDLKPQSHDPTGALSHVLALHVETYALFHDVFPPTSSFWQRFRAYFDRYLYACRKEKTFALGKRSWKEFDEQTALEIATGKASLSHAVIAGMAALQQDEHALKVLSEALDMYNFAYQMFDDLCDWKEDYLRQLPSLLLCRWLPERPEPRQADLEALARELYYDGHACTVLQLASDAAERALQLTKGFPDLAWRIIPGNLHERCESLCSDILKITEVNRRRLMQRVRFSIELPQARTLCEQLAWRGLRYLVRQWQRGFGELRDITRFAHNDGFTGKSEFQYGDIFQRAVVADIVWEASCAFQLDIEVLLDYETRYLLEHRCPNGIGGWSYYPDLPEMPPDADDLAQIMQLLLHRGWQGEIARLCEQPLATLLNENCHEDGSFETWIIPRQQRTAEQEQQFSYCETVWGTGADVDVMANLLYALVVYDPERFARVIDAGVAYIEGQQQADGSWLSTWYHGPYYGTFVCTRLLAQVKPDSRALNAVQDFLVNSQLPDGSWADNEDKGNALSTALALLGWLELARAGMVQPDASRIEKALLFLQQCYDEEEQAWPYCDFIRMAEGRLIGTITRVASYGSQCITTAFVLKAVAGCHLLQNQRLPGTPRETAVLSIPNLLPDWKE